MKNILLRNFLFALLFCFTSIACSGSKLDSNKSPNNLEGFDEDVPLTLENIGDIPNMSSGPTESSQPPLTLDGPANDGGVSLTPEVEEDVPEQSVIPPSVPGPLPVISQQPTSDCHSNNNVSASAKILFVVDKSRWQNYKYDPVGQTRLHYIRNYYQERENSGWSWGLIAFHSINRAYPLIRHPRKGNQPVFTANNNTFRQALNVLANIPDEDPEDATRDPQRVGTQYGYSKALNLVKDTIKHDLENDIQHNSNYYVYFIAGARPRGDLEHRYEDRIFKKVREIVNLRPGKIRFSTVYYGADVDTASRHRYTSRTGPIYPDRDVKSVLKHMAKIVRGDFFELPTIGGGHYNTPCSQQGVPAPIVQQPVVTTPCLQQLPQAVVPFSDDVNSFVPPQQEHVIQPHETQPGTGFYVDTVDGLTDDLSPTQSLSPCQQQIQGEYRSLIEPSRQLAFNSCREGHVPGSFCRMKEKRTFNW